MNTSSNNQNILLAKKLLQKKYRDLEGKYLAEGAKLVSEALLRNQKIDYLVVCDKQISKYEHLLCKAKYYSVDEKTFKSLTDTVTNQGILAVICKPDLPLSRPAKNALILDRVQDPSNVGAILRTAAASGYDDVYMIECADAYSPKSIRAGMSSQFCLNIYTGTQEEIISTVKENCTLICADMDGEDVFSCNVTGNHALLLGNEGSGVQEQLKAICDKTITIPMANGMESLNVAVSASILMYLLSFKNKR